MTGPEQFLTNKNSVDKLLIKIYFLGSGAILGRHVRALQSAFKLIPGSTILIV